MQIDLDLRTMNSLWASVLVETLARAGVRYAVVSPGSRSAPLAIALSRSDRIKAIPVLDERSAAFFALGLAKCEVSPVVLVCTSGTAAANYFPAVIEAHESGVSILVITADRPPELRACASGQTIDQQKIYGEFVNFYHELALPELDAARLAYLRQTVMHALARTSRPQKGAVHLNAPFRDPLAPVSDGGVAEAFGKTMDWARFFGEISPSAEVFSVTPQPTIASDVHGVIVVGPSQPADPKAFAVTIGEMAARLGWPVLADGLAPVRSYAACVPNLVTTYDTILRNAAAAERLSPDVVICINGWPTSKVLRAWLDTAGAPTWLISDRGDNRDALHGRTHQLPVALKVFVENLPQATAPSGYERMWSRYEQRVRGGLDDRLHAEQELVEPKAAWVLAQHLPPNTPLFVANSMPIRDVEYVWPAGHGEISPRCNRGANGIDGTLSSAMGVARASSKPSVLLTGDLALLHDANGFLLRSQLGTSLTIVLINNRGGGIFEHLPVSQFEPPFESFFATPQDVDFRQLCGAHGVEHVLVRDWRQFAELVSTLPAEGVRLLELQTDRKRDAAMRKRWFAEIAANLT
jgi:2-succinyl-5-enolpyruvyl-6-hydroxy-3-cyclohexene-1-carboxylate synthase